jgi:hypothetical protein
LTSTQPSQTPSTSTANCKCVGCKFAKAHSLDFGEYFHVKDAADFQRKLEEDAAFCSVSVRVLNAKVQAHRRKVWLAKDRLIRAEKSSLLQAPYTPYKEAA